MNVSLVIPGRNTEKTLSSCLESVVPLLGQNGLMEIIFVNDGSTDGTEDIAKSFNEVIRLRSDGRGPAAARNTGLKAARGDLVWFMDSDCEAEPGALAYLLEPMTDPQVAGVGGSFGNPVESSLLACLVHEEIVQRHLGMPPRVNYLASGNVLYRRDVLERLGGFEEALIKAEDTELSYRIKSSDRQLAFARKSIVKHHHHTALGRYLKTQYGNAYWRVFLYVNYPAHMGGDSYSGLTDHVQPPLAMLTLALIAASFFLPALWWGVLEASCSLRRLNFRDDQTGPPFGAEIFGVRPHGVRSGLCPGGWNDRRGLQGSGGPVGLYQTQSNRIGTNRPRSVRNFGRASSFDGNGSDSYGGASEPIRSPRTSQS